MIHRLDLKTAQRLMNTKDFSLKAFLITSNLDFSPPLWNNKSVSKQNLHVLALEEGKGKKEEDTPRIVLAFTRSAHAQASPSHFTGRAVFLLHKPRKRGL